jgi:hypothetical protein
MDRETRQFMLGMKRRRAQWDAWCRRQIPIFVRLLKKAERLAEKGWFFRAKKATWDAMQAMNELDTVWRQMSVEGNTFIKTIPKGWKRKATS